MHTLSNIYIYERVIGILLLCIYSRVKCMIDKANTLVYTNNN